MPSQWHYSKGGTQHGPVSSERLREIAASGELSPADLVWKEGLPDWRPASSLKGLFPETPAKPVGPPPLPTAMSGAQPQPPPAVMEMDAPDAVATTVEAASPTPPRKPDFFDKARALAQKAQAKAEEFQREAQAMAERMQEQARANPNTAQVAITRGAKAAVDYARSEDAKVLARKTRDTVKGGAMAATALAGAASAEGRERVRKAAEHPLGVGAALLFFFPLGLYLVWHHPQWNQTRKLAWTGAWLGVFFLMMVPAMMAPRVVIIPAPQVPSVGRPSAKVTTEPQVSATASAVGPASQPAKVEADDTAYWNQELGKSFDKVYDLRIDPNLPVTVVGVKNGYATIYTRDLSTLQGSYWELGNSDLSKAYGESVSGFTSSLEGNKLHYSWYRPSCGQCDYTIDLVTKVKAAK